MSTQNPFHAANVRLLSDLSRVQTSIQERADCRRRETLLVDLQMAVAMVCVTRAAKDEVAELAAWSDLDRAWGRMQEARGIVPKSVRS